MPCRDYEDDRSVGDRWALTVKQMQGKMDRLARIACRAMEALEKVAPTNEVFDIEEQSTWWNAHKIADAKAMAEKKAMAKAATATKNLAAKKQAALEKISKEDRKLLGL